MNLKPQPVNKRNNTIIAWFVFFSALIIYALTQARSLSFWDAGEYITCSSILGIPHPPGNPFYIILGRFFNLVGRIFHLHDAFVSNLLSSILSAFAVMFTYLITVKLITMFLRSKKDAYFAYLGGFIAAFYIAFSYSFWNNAIEAEVLAGLAFVINLIIWLTLVWVQKSENLSHQNLLLLIIYIFFLGFGIHQTSLQIAPAVLFIVVYPLLKNNIKTSGFWYRTLAYTFGIIFIYLIFNGIGKSVHLPALSKYMFALAFALILYYHLRKEVPGIAWILALILILIGLSPHIFLLIRSKFRPFINEGNPHNWSAFTYYIFRRQYGATSMFVRRASFLYQIKDQFLTYFSWQFFHPETIVAWLKIPANAVQALANLIVTFLGLGGAYYQFKKNKHSFAYLFSFFFMASIAMVFVMNLSDKEVRTREYFFITAYNLWAIWMGIGSIALLDLFRKKVKVLIPVVLIIILGLPVINFASNYFIHNRSKQLIPLDYGQNILNGLEKNAIVFTNGDNDTFPVWYAQAVQDPFEKEHIYQATDVFPTEKTKQCITKGMNFKNSECKGIRKDVSVANLSLLNTPWYIFQLRDREGIEFNIPDKHIELCQDDRRSALYPRQLDRDYTIKIQGIRSEDNFTVTYKRGDVLYTKDLAVLEIIKDNYGKRPIYFAVTVSSTSGFDYHLRNEGMVDRVVSKTGKNQYNINRLTTNIDSVYLYRGVFDKKIYKDENMKRLLNNYGAAFMRASQYFRSENDYGKSIKYMEKAIKFIDDKKRFYPSISQLDVEAAFNFIEKKMYDEAFVYLADAIYYNRTDPSLSKYIYQAGKVAKAPDKAIELLKKLQNYQDDKRIPKYIEVLQKEKNSLQKDKEK